MTLESLTSVTPPFQFMFLLCIVLFSWAIYLLPESLSHCYTAVKRHHDQDNAYERKHLIGTCLQFPLVHYHHSREHSGLQVGDGAVAESYNLIHREREGRQAWHGLLKLQSLLSMTSSNKAIPTSPYNPFKLFYSLVIKHSSTWACGGAFLFKPPHLAVSSLLIP